MVISFACLVPVRKAFAFQHDGFVPREWLAAKGVLVVDALLEFNLSSVYLVRRFKQPGGLLSGSPVDYSF